MSEGNNGQIGRYKVLDEIGRGGFGRVYRAFDASVGRHVAIKLLTAAGKDVFARFKNEAQVAGNLRHENIVTVYEYGDHEGQPFLVMEYLEGEDLQHILSSGKQLTLLEKCNIMSQVAEGLDCAHRHGVVHRDVKPANIMVLPDGRVKIMDFGIARITQDRDATRLTQEGWMVGTLLYMAPEQLSAGEVDALCDIFAYGVVYYELLAGRHPFQSPDSRTLMFKISFEDPPPLRDFLPQCPEQLDRVISKILQKDRELRYRSLKDVQFDTEIVRMDLQALRAGELIAQAQVQIQADQLDAGQSLVAEALGLDPSNRAARSLRETLQKRLQHRTLQPRIDGLRRAAEDHLAHRNFSDAVKNFEAALKLDSENTELQGRHAQALDLLEHFRTAQDLVAEAQKELGRQNLTVAYQCASEALRHDRENPTAAELIAKIRIEVENRQREKRIEEALRKTEDLILSHSYDEAISLLAGLGAEAASPKVAELLSWLKKEKSDRERREKLQAEMAVVTDLLRTRSLAEALNRLEGLRKAYPDEREPEHLLAYTRKELEIEARAKAIKELTAKAGALVDSKDFNSALSLLEEALKQYPGETTLIRMLGSSMAAKTAWERQQAIAKTVRESAQLRSEQRLAEAIELVETALREYTAEPELAALLEQLEQEWAGKRRAEAVRKAADSALQLLDRKQPLEAQQLLRQALIQYSGESRLVDLLNRADEELRAAAKARAIEGIVRDASGRAAAADFSRALAIVDQGLKSWPAEPDLLSLRERIAGTQAAAAKRKEIEAFSQRAAALAANRDFNAALAVLTDAARKYPGEAELAKLRDRIASEWERHKRQEAVRSIASEARLLLSRGRLDEAAEILNEGLAQHPGDADLQALNARAREAVRAREQARVVEQLVRESNTLAASHQFDKARKVLEEGLVAYPAEQALLREVDAVNAAKEKWEREQAIARAIAEAARLATELRFDAALELLARAPGSPEVAEARQRIEQERDAHKAREAVSKGAAEASALLQNGRPDTALKLLEQLSTRYPEDPQWNPLMAQAREAVAGRKAAEERRRAIEETIRDCDALVRQDRFEDALERVAGTLRQYSGEPALLDLQERLKLSWQERQRVLGVERAGAEAASLMETGRLEEAVAFLRQSSARYPAEVSLRTLLAKAEKDLADRQERERTLAECQALLEQRKYEEACRHLDRAVARFRDDAGLAALAAKARAELNEQVRQDSVTALAEEALSVSKAHDFDRALLLLERGLGTWPGEERLLQLQQSIRGEQTAWKRERSRRQALQEVNQLFRKERFREAGEKADAALRTFADDPEFLRLRNECRMRQILADAATLSAQGNPAEALRRMESAPEYAAAPEWQALMERLRTQLATLESGAAIRKAIEEARALAARADFEGALALIDAKLHEAPGDAALEDARRWVLEAQQAHQRQVAAKKAVEECTRLVDQARIPEAIESIDKALREFPDEPALPLLRRRAQDELQAEERRQQRQADLAQLPQLETLIAQAQNSSRFAELGDLARRTDTQYPGDDEIRSAAAQVTAHLEDIASCQQSLSQRNFAAALDLSAKYVARFPQHAAFLTFQAEANQGLRAVYLEEARRKTEGEADLVARAKILEEAQTRYPDESWVAAELKITRNKLEMVEAIVAQARSHEAAESWEQALERWNELAAIYDRFPGLNDEINRVRAAQARATASAIARWRAQIEPLIDSGQFGKAQELLQRALTEIPGATELLELGRKLEELKKQQQLLRDLLNAMRELRKGRKWDEFEVHANQALELSAGDAASRKSVLERLIEGAQDVVQTDWRRAEAWVARVRSADSVYPVPKQLLKSVTEAKRAAAIETALARAEESRKAGNLREAVAHLAETLREFPDEARLKSRYAAIDAELQKQRANLSRALAEIRQACERAVQLSDLDPLNARVAAITTDVSQDQELAADASGTGRVLALRRRQLSRARLLGAFTSHRKWILIAGAAAAVLAAGALVVPKMFSPVHTVAVTVTSDTAGATVEAGGAKCTTPQCTLNLKPGSYTLTAAKDGFAAISQPLIVSAAEPEPKVPLTFRPLPEELQLNTNFESGNVELDGGAAVALRDGQFSTSGLKPGRHSIRVTGRDGEFHAEWQSAPGAPPELLTPVSAKNLQAAVVANAGRLATVACNCEAGSVSVDGAPAGQIAGTASVKLPQLQQGPRQITVAGRSVTVNILPNPALNIFLALDRNAGTLIVATGEDNVKVYLNNRLYPRQTEHGVLRIPVNVGEYAIRVEKDSFHSPAAQTTAIAKGEEKQVTFNLTQALLALQIAGAQPHARVEIDHRPAGETDANGGFRAEVPAGRHSIGLTKDGYAPVRFDEQFTAGRGPVRPSAAQLAMSKLPGSQPPVAQPPVETKSIDTEPQDWTRASNSGRAQDLQDYLQKHAGGAHARDAQTQIDQLQQQAQKADAAKGEQAAWDSVDKNNKAALQDFLSRHANSPRAQDARNLLDGIQKRETADAETKRLEQEKATRADNDAVLRTIADYEAAFNRMDLTAMQQLYNPLPAALQKQFKDSKSVSFQLKPVEAPSVSGSSATVACTRTQSSVFRNGDRSASPPERVRVTLVRNGTRWVIREIAKI